MNFYIAPYLPARTAVPGWVDQARWSWSARMGRPDPPGDWVDWVRWCGQTVPGPPVRADRARLAGLGRPCPTRQSRQAMPDPPIWADRAWPTRTGQPSLSLECFPRLSGCSCVVHKKPFKMSLKMNINGRPLVDNKRALIT